jgi:hypothetical protein
LHSKTEELLTTFSPKHWVTNFYQHLLLDVSMSPQVWISDSSPEIYFPFLVDSVLKS